MSHVAMAQHICQVCGSVHEHNTEVLLHKKLKDIPEWSFDGSSTNQAEGSSSDCILKPVKLYQDPLRNGFSYLVMCEVMNPDGTPHKTNTRSGKGGRLFCSERFRMAQLWWRA